MDTSSRALLSRRHFLALSTLAAASGTFAPTILGASDPVRSVTKPLRILILGGTGFLGPACTESALARGHRVTHFNRGRMESRRREMGRPSVVPSGVEQLYGNRDPEKTADDNPAGGTSAPRDPKSPKGLSQLKGKKWDAVIDTSGYFPRMVRASAELLAPSVKQYVFISSISVYKDNSKPGYDETAAIHTLANPTSEDMGKNYENYGGGKADCERAAETAMPGRVTDIRPGYIVGPRDPSGRFMYWPARVALGGDMIVPGAPTDPIQLIDVRDLSDWIIRCIEQKIVGVFNATGPEQELSMKAMLEGIRQGVGAKTEFRWLSLDRLEALKVSLGRFPLYAPPAGDTAGFHRCSIARALKAGLKFRSVADTAKVTLEWYKSLPAELQARMAPQLATKAGEESWVDLEKKVIKACQESKTGTA
jgi:2'-hydroxyisoflavone reductase